ncbi:hypothetical protein [Rubrobacter calidifluminis]|uniref:hypothetical protein n=1 Tax=Rubrobacter calidifluminis TaxID=1392640 RepID=UPI0023604BBE|nr:hypothetical protein [Rubrobacter calidifluminis]
MSEFRETGRAAEAFASGIGESYRAVVDHVVGLQERNLRFVLGIWDRVAEEARHQSAANREFAKELAERVEAQRENVRKLAGEITGSYLDLLYAPLAYYRQGLRLIEGGIEETELPIEGYDDLSVAEISKRLDGLSVEEIRIIRDYERLHKNRESLLEQLDRRLKPAVS